MSLLNKREIYAPFEYPKANEFWENQQQAHWLHTEISMASDIADWKNGLTEDEKKLIGSILKIFTQLEIFIEDYWSNKVSNWFKKPEIQMMSACFANMESIHAKAYAYLNDSLGFEDYTAFLYEPTAKAKLDRLMMTKGKSKQEIALSLAVFSAFNEGVNLFSSFAILMSFSRFNKLKGVAQIIAFSIRDESLHSKAGCWLFNTFIQEYPEVNTEEFKEKIYDAARLTVKLEHEFLDEAFKDTSIEGLAKDEIKEYIKFRTNKKLKEINMEEIYEIDMKAIDSLEWFDVLCSGVEHADFFSTRVSTYVRGTKDWSKVECK